MNQNNQMNDEKLIRNVYIIKKMCQPNKFYSAFEQKSIEYGHDDQPVF